MQAVKKVWTDEVNEHLQSLLARAVDPVAPVRADPLPEPLDILALRGSLAADAEPVVELANVVRPEAFMREPAPAASPTTRRSSALDAILTAAELFEEAEREADRKVQRALDIASRTLAQLEAAEEQLRSANKTVQDLKGVADEAARIAAAKLASAETIIGASHDRILSLEADVNRLRARLSDSDALVLQATHRAYAAETRASEAHDDIKSLAGKVREALGQRRP